jgi:hypothetical protein
MYVGKIDFNHLERRTGYSSENLERGPPHLDTLSTMLFPVPAARGPNV